MVGGTTIKGGGTESQGQSTVVITGYPKRMPTFRLILFYLYKCDVTFT
jgi:hypothetical protein